MTAAAAHQTHEPHSRPSFRERVHALTGHTTYREPVGGRVAMVKPIPADHMIAAALSFGRHDQTDIGPDIAFDMATGRVGHAPRVLRWLGAVLASDRAASCKRLRPWAALYAVWAYNALVQGHQMPPAPDGVCHSDHGEVLLFACLLLEHAAEDALALAARRARAA